MHPWAILSLLPISVYIRTLISIFVLMHSWNHWYHLWIQCLVCVIHIPPSHWAHPHPHQAHWGSWYSWTCEHLPVPRFGCVPHLHPDSLMGWDLDVHQPNPPLKTGLSLQRNSDFNLGL